MNRYRLPACLIILLHTLTARDAIGEQVRYIVTDIGVLPGGTFSTGLAISENGQVTGYGDTSSVPPLFVRAFLYDGSLIELGTLGGGQSIGAAINNQGHVAGYSHIPGNSVQRAFLYDGAMHDVGSLGGPASEARAINNNGQIAGTSHTSPGGEAHHAFLYDGQMRDLGTFGGTHSLGLAVNSLGHVAGSADTVANTQHVFLYDGVMRDLGSLGGSISGGSGINESDQVVGYSNLPGDRATHAFLYSNGTMIDLGTLGGARSFALDINNLGQIVGRSDLANGTRHAFLFEQGVMKDLNSLLDDPSSGWIIMSADAVNDRGQIAGTGMLNGQTRAVLLTPATPVPEPMTCLLFLSALVFLAPVALRQGWARWSRH